MSFRSSFRTSAFLAATAMSIAVPAIAHGATDSKAMREALVADYPLTKTGMVGFQIDRNRITQPGAILAVRLPGIYADIANTKNVIVNTNYSDGQLSQAPASPPPQASPGGAVRTGRPGMHPSVWQVAFRHRCSRLSGSLPFHEAHRARPREHCAHKFQSFGVPSKVAKIRFVQVEAEASYFRIRQMSSPSRPNTQVALWRQPVG